MLRFIVELSPWHVIISGFQYIQCYGSSVSFSSVAAIPLEFQYIQCYGSSKMSIDVTESDRDFNTSNVTVHRLISELDSKLIDISIHPMLRFIHGISIHPMLRFIAWTTTP